MFGSLCESMIVQWIDYMQWFDVDVETECLLIGLNDQLYELSGLECVNHMTWMSMLMWIWLGADRLIQAVEFFGWRHFQWRKISQGRRHFRWRKISQSRRHKDYLDKSEIGSTRNQREALTKFYENAKSFFLLKTKTNTYSVSEQKDKNKHGPSKQFGPKLQ